MLYNTVTIYVDGTEIPIVRIFTFITQYMRKFDSECGNATLLFF